MSMRSVVASRLLRWPGAAQLAILGALSLLLVGCGDSPWAATSRASLGDATGTVKTWLMTCAEGNGQAALEPLTEPERENIFTAPSVIEGCERVARLSGGSPMKPDQLKALFEATKVDRVEVNAGSGTASLSSPKGRADLDLELDRGTWQISHPDIPGT